MSRITIDLRKRAKERIRYDLSRYVVEDEYGPYCYQLSQFHFRDVITGGRSMPRNTGIPPSTMGNTTNITMGNTTAEITMGNTITEITTVPVVSEDGGHR